ncbi:Hsp20/alpha crystallin family protein [Castellaniella sp.]|uniref:Hsp20/alpha crystallin family protein n=1 Tax=Castellaniella sp. TaxID=1955812 RepID=UPI00355D8636
MTNDLARFNPFAELSGFEELFNRFPVASRLAQRAEEPRINIDVTESDSAYTVKAEVPGVRKEDVKVAIEGNTVSIRVEKTAEDIEKEGETVLRRERYRGVQVRRFSLAHDIDVAGSEARCTDGVLELSLPKKVADSTSKWLEVR